MVTKRDDDDDRRQPGEYRAICLGKVGRQSFAKYASGKILHMVNVEKNLSRSLNVKKVLHV